MNTEETDLLCRLRDGDHKAFEQIYHNYKIQLSNILFKLLKYEELVEEVLQELFVRLWNNRETIQIDKPIQAYLYRITINLANDYYRQISKDKKLADRLWEELTSRYDPFENICEVAADEELFRVIDLLPPQRKKVFILCKFEKKNYIEVGQMLQVSQAAVNDHITRANKFIKEHYNKTSPIISLLLAQYISDQINKL